MGFARFIVPLVMQLGPGRRRTWGEHGSRLRTFVEGQGDLVVSRLRLGWLWSDFADGRY